MGPVKQMSVRTYYAALSGVCPGRNPGVYRTIDPVRPTGSSATYQNYDLKRSSFLVSKHPSYRARPHSILLHGLYKLTASQLSSSVRWRRWSSRGDNGFVSIRTRTRTIRQLRRWPADSSVEHLCSADIRPKCLNELCATTRCELKAGGECTGDSLRSECEASNKLNCLTLLAAREPSCRRKLACEAAFA
jgi:hypothetical protein